MPVADASSADVTQVYAERDLLKGIEVARRIGVATLRWSCAARSQDLVENQHGEEKAAKI